MSNEYFQPAGWPATGSKGSSATARAERASIEGAFDKMPVLTAKAGLPVFVNSGATALESITADAARTALGLAIGVDILAYDAELAALAGLIPAATNAARFTGSETADLMPILDEDDFVSSSATGVAVQQSIVAYVGALISAKTQLLEAPSATKALAYNAAAPSGWTIGTGLDNRIIMIHATLTGEFGTNAIDSSQTSGNESQHHTHNVTTTAGTDVEPRFAEMGAGSFFIANEHSHSISINDDSSEETQNHDHVVSGAKGLYVIQITKT